MSASTLSDLELRLAPERRQELALLIDHQADRLARLAANLLDMGRIQAGVLEPRRELVPLPDLISEAVRSLAATVDPGRVRIELPDHLPLVEVDRLLMGETIFNLLENAARHAPAGAPIVIGGGVPRRRDDRVLGVRHRAGRASVGTIGRLRHVQPEGGRRGGRARARDCQGIRRGARRDDLGRGHPRWRCEILRDLVDPDPSRIPIDHKWRGYSSLTTTWRCFAAPASGSRPSATWC